MVESHNVLTKKAIPSPYVFTVFFCGTASNSFDIQNEKYPTGELISTLASHHSGIEFVDWIIVDGPGSGNLQEDDKWVTPGNYIPKQGEYFGSGWEENVAHAVAVIKGDYTWNRKKLTAEQAKKLQIELAKKINKDYLKKDEDDNPPTLTHAGIKFDDPKVSGSWYWRTYEYPNRKVTPQELQAQKAKNIRKGKLPDVVNIIGWSRGGVSCHMLANAMFKDEKLQNIKVNILALDPVPGPLNFQEHRTTIQKNVKEYVGVYARDERSSGFTPIVPKFSEETQVTILPIPGRHATLVGNAALDGDSGKQELFEPGILIRDLSEKILTIWGTKLNDSTTDKLIVPLPNKLKEMSNLKEIKSLKEISNPRAKTLIEQLKTIQKIKLENKIKSLYCNFPGKLNLQPEDIEWLYSRMREDFAKYKAMQSIYYTKIPDGRGEERYVSVGKDGTSTKFFQVKNQSNPKFNLAPVEEYISWHHKQVDQELKSPQISKSISQATSNLFPNFSPELNYALSNESVLLNGMKVIFDEPVNVYPINLESKEESKHYGSHT